jgi:agmatinase
MREMDKKILMKSDYLRKEAELFIDYISKGSAVEENKFMFKSLKEINAGSEMMNNWVYEQTKDLLLQNKLVGIIGGDHSTPLGYYKALAEKYGSFGILQIDAHCDLRKSYLGFMYSHASIMYNALETIPEIERLIQIAVRDYSEEEWNYICKSNYRVISYFDDQIKQRLYEGQHWNYIADTIVDHLPQQVHISFDVDGLDPKLCPQTGTPRRHRGRRARVARPRPCRGAELSRRRERKSRCPRSAEKRKCARPAHRRTRGTGDWRRRRTESRPLAEATSGTAGT